MNIQSNEVTRQRLDLYRQAMSEAGYDDEAISRNVADTWVWRNIFVADSNSEAESVGVPCFREMRAFLSDNRLRLNTAEEQALQSTAMQGAARDSVDHGLIHGSPERVCEELSELYEMGVGGVIIHFRLGPMSREAAENSLRLFAGKVAPEFSNVAIV